MSCSECDRRRRYMSADPEMYRGEDTRCTPHQKEAAHNELLQVAKEIKQARGMSQYLHGKLTRAIGKVESA